MALFPICLTAGGNAEIQSFSISYTDGSYGIKCINPLSLTENQVKSEIESITAVIDEGKTVDITNDVNIGKNGSQWVATYTFKDGWWVFGDERAISAPIKFNKLISLDIIYPDGNEKCLRVNHSNIESSDLRRLKIQANFNEGQEEDITSDCELTLNPNNSVQVRYKIKSQEYVKTFNLNIDTLVNLKATRLNENNSILADYPQPSVEEVRNNVKITATYSSNAKIDVTDIVSFKNANGILTFTLGDQEDSIALDKLERIQASTISGNKLEVVDSSKLSDKTLRNRLVVTAQYSNGYTQDITNDVTIKLVNNSSLSFSYGDIQIAENLLSGFSSSHRSFLYAIAVIAIAFAIALILLVRAIINRQKTLNQELAEIENTGQQS